jgi:M6 family metalloprotease-like protein
VASIAAAGLLAGATPALANHPVSPGPTTWVDKLSGKAGLPLRTNAPPPVQVTESAKGSTGAESRAVLLCRYTDSPNASALTAGHFQGLFGQLADYFDEASYGQLDFTSTVFDWKSMGNPRAAYGTVSGDNVNMNTDTLASDCANAHDATVDFSQFDAIDVILDEHQGFDAAGVGGTTCGPNVDAHFGCWPYTVIPADEAGVGVPGNGRNGMALWVHEIGHSINLPHSVSPYWDPLSFPCSGSYLGGGEDPAYGCLPVHYSGPQKDSFKVTFTDPWGDPVKTSVGLGWIPGARRANVAAGKKATVNLERLAEPANNGNPLIARAQVKGTTPKVFYTAEARMEVPGNSYDSAGNLPGDGVVIHRVMPGCKYGEPPCKYDYAPAQVEGQPGGVIFDDPNFGLWTPGEKFSKDGVVIKVLEELAQGYKIKVINNSA